MTRVNTAGLRALDGFGLNDGARTFALFENAGALSVEAGASEAVLDVVVRLNEHKRDILWVAEEWEGLLAAAAMQESFDDFVTIIAPEVAFERPRVGEFARRLAIIDLLLTGDMTRESVLASLLARATLLPLAEVLARMDAVKEARLPDDDLETLPKVGGLSRPSLSTDVDALRAMGFGFEPNPVHRSRQAYRLDMQRLPLWVDSAGATALRNAGKLLRQIGISEAEALEAMLSRVPSAVQGAMDDWDAGQLLVGPQDNVDGEVLQLLRDALGRGARVLKIFYRSVTAGQPKYYVLEHPRLNWFEGHLYVLGHCPQATGETRHDKNREFRLDRFVKAPGRQVVQMMKGGVPTLSAMPSFTLSFLAQPDFVARFRTGPDGIRVHPPGPDGSAVIEVTEWIPLRAVRRLLSYGDRIQPLGPDFVVERYYATIRQIAATAPQ